MRRSILLVLAATSCNGAEPSHAPVLLPQAPSEPASAPAAIEPRPTLPAPAPTRPVCKAPPPGDAPEIERLGRVEVMRQVGHGDLLPRDVFIVPPQGDDDIEGAPHPVLYVHDGEWIGDDAMAIVAAMDRLTADGAIEPHFVVGIGATAEREQELKPPRLEVYGELVTEVIKPWVDRRHRTRCDAGSTAIVGFSLGGLANVYFATWYPQTFSRIAAMSPSLWWHGGQAVRDFVAGPGPLPDRLWLDVGTREGRAQRGRPSSAVVRLRALRDAATARGMVVGGTLGYLEDEGARHDLAAAKARAPQVLRFLLAST